MIANNWKKMLAKAGKKQNELAFAVGINKGEFSRVCAGASVPAWDVLCTCCEVLRCAPLDIYGEAELNVMYQIDLPKQSKKRQRIRVQISYETSMLLEAAVASGEYESRYSAVNTILQEALQ